MSVTAVIRKPTPEPEAVLVAALRRRDEDAYLALVRRYTPLMLRIAHAHLGRRDAAEDVVQDTWVAVLRSIDGFEGRSSFKTWLMRILVNTARTRRGQESRTVCWSSLPEDAAKWDAAVHRADVPWTAVPERSALAGEVWAELRCAVGELPERQRAVVVLRDVEGWSADEVRGALRLSPGNQRVLLHRGRARLRALLGPYRHGPCRAASPRVAPQRVALQQPQLAGAGDGLGA
jgi:RNA polymerase sigma-70 factor (ECF subfamily)